MSFFRRRVRLLPAIAAAVVVAFSIGVRSASATIPTLELALEYDGSMPIGWNPNPSGVDLGGGLYSFSGSYTHIYGEFTLDWAFIVNVADPLVSGNFGFENLTLDTHHFAMTLTLPVNAAPGPQLMGGSATIGLTASPDGGAIASWPWEDGVDPPPEGNPVWQALVDGASVQDLFHHPFELTASGAGSASASDNFGTPIPSAPAPPINGTIGVRTEFYLTSFDQASIGSVFVITPAPGGLALLALGMMTRRRRRRE